ncbi:nucleoside-diphosphate kinase [Clostridium paraputrificum]|uniref:nucleoside-diphosphate kinase n=1 Tax=Clostridium TaxID=1485 RepID=UPI003D34634E
MVMEKSLVLIKPDAVEKNLIGKIISHYERVGLKVVALKMERVSNEIADKHYEEHQGKVFYNDLISFITRSPLCALILEGNNAVEVVRKINGSTNPAEAAEGTIRREFAKDKSENCVHASDSQESAEREISIWFPELESASECLVS